MIPRMEKGLSGSIRGMICPRWEDQEKKNWDLVLRLQIQRPGVTALTLPPRSQNSLKTTNQLANSLTHPPLSVQFFLAIKSEVWLEAEQRLLTKDIFVR